MNKRNFVRRFLAVAFALTLCFGSLASGEEMLHGLLSRIGDGENPVAYTISTTEYGEMAPAEGYVPFFADLLKDAVLTPADAKETPDGVYVVLSFPEEKLRFDFFLSEGDKSYVRQVNADKSEELFEVTMPGNTVSTPAGLMGAAADALAEELGLLGNVWAQLPEEGWVLDSLNGYFWQDDRASLQVFLEDTDNFKVLITWGSSAWESREWTYTCEYDPDTQTLNATRVICEDITWDDQGNETRTPVFETECATVFSLNEEGRLVITDAGDEQLEGKSFGQVDLLEEASDEPES